MTGSQTQKRAIVAPEGHYLPNRKQALLLRLLGIRDDRQLPEKVCQVYTQKTELQGQERR